MSHIFEAPVGVIHWNITKTFGIRKLDYQDYHWACFCVMTYLAALIEVRPVMDGQDGQTQGHDIYRASIVSRGTNRTRILHFAMFLRNTADGR